MDVNLYVVVKMLPRTPELKYARKHLNKTCILGTCPKVTWLLLYYFWCSICGDMKACYTFNNSDFLFTSLSLSTLSLSGVYSDGLNQKTTLLFSGLRLMVYCFINLPSVFSISCLFYVFEIFLLSHRRLHIHVVMSVVISFLNMYVQSSTLNRWNKSY